MSAASSSPTARYPSLTAPILFRFALHRRRRRVLDLEPVIDPSRAVQRAEPLRHDALAAETASVLVDDRTVALIMLVQGDAKLRALQRTEKLFEPIFPPLDWIGAQVIAIELDKIESAKHGGMVMAPGAQQIEGREAVLVNHNGLAVDEAGLHREALDRFDNAREAAGEVRAVAGV